MKEEAKFPALKHAGGHCHVPVETSTRRAAEIVAPAQVAPTVRLGDLAVGGIQLLLLVLGGVVRVGLGPGRVVEDRLEVRIGCDDGVPAPWVERQLGPAITVVDHAQLHVVVRLRQQGAVVDALLSETERSLGCDALANLVAQRQRAVPTLFAQVLVQSVRLRLSERLLCPIQASGAFFADHQRLDGDARVLAAP